MRYSRSRSIEFFAESVGGDGVDVDFGTQGGLGLGSNGFNFGFVSGDVQAALNAFAQNQRVNVLSTPRLVARSGGAASIQVGTDVPVITSQQATEQQSGTGGTDVFQSVQFRQTGVLLNIEPIVFGSGRVDLNVSQEVSNAQPNPNQAIASPIIQNRNITTQLTLDDGGTAVLGGLIQDNVVRGDTGIPLLKDIPWLGALFSVDSLSVERTELLVVITAYIIRSGEDRRRFVDYLTDQINKSLADPFKLRTRLPRQDGCAKSATMPSAGLQERTPRAASRAPTYPNLRQGRISPSPHVLPCHGRSDSLHGHATQPRNPI